MKGKMIAFEFMRTKIANRPMSSWLVVVNSGLAPVFFFFSSRRRHTRSLCDWSSDVCSSDLGELRARDGDLVKAGDVVVRLDDTVTKASLAIVVKTLDGLWARAARLQAEQQGVDSIVFPPMLLTREIGRASCRERVEVWGVAG